MDDVGLYLLECTDYIEVLTHDFNLMEEPDDSWIDNLTLYAV